MMMVRYGLGASKTAFFVLSDKETCEALGNLLVRGGELPEPGLRT